MSKQVKTLEQLKDSRLLYDKKLPRFGYYIILSILVLLFIVVIWSIKAPKVYIIKANGTVQSFNKNYIMSAYSGKISNLKISEGCSVEEGDILFTVKSTELDLQELQAKGQMETYENKIVQYEKLEKSIKDDTNYFDENKDVDKEDYNRFETYHSKVNQNQFDSSTFAAYGYTEDQIKNEIEKNQEKIAEIYYSTLQDIEKSKSEIQTNIDNLKVQADSISNGQSEYQVTANTTGIVHMMSEYKDGMVVQAGSAIASIANEKDDYRIQTFVSLSDVPRIKMGEKVDMVVVGLNQSIYGTITGKVTSIDSDMTTNTSGDEKESYFKVTITPDSNYLISKEGNKVNISNGLAVEARIQYDEITYFNYVMEALGVLTK